MTYKIPYPKQTKYWKLKVCLEDGTNCKKIDGRYEYYYTTDIIEDTEIDNYRYFTMHLPPGKYRAVFVDEHNNQIWPGFVQE